MPPRLRRTKLSEELATTRAKLNASETVKAGLAARLLEVEKRALSTELEVWSLSAQLHALEAAANRGPAGTISVGVDLILKGIDGLSTIALELGEREAYRDLQALAANILQSMEPITRMAQAENGEDA